VRQVYKVVIRILGAGLPAGLVAGRIGEAEELAEAAGRAGRAVPARRVVALAADNVLADRLARTHWTHLPTLLAPATVLLAAGTAVLALASPASPQTYGVQTVALAVLAAVLLTSRRCPHRVMAVVAVVLAAAILYELPATLAAGLSSYRQGSRPLPTDGAGALALLVAAVGMPAGLVPPAVTRARLTWAQLAGLVRGSRGLRWTWRITAAALAVLAAAAATGAVADVTPSMPVRVALAVDGIGLVTAAVGVTAVGSVRYLGRGETAQPPA
jgi:hypothetical protein